MACDFSHDSLPISMAEYRDFVGVATGYYYSLEEWSDCAERVETTLRLFNCREGFSRTDDIHPLRILEEPLVDGPAKGQLFVF